MSKLRLPVKDLLYVGKYSKTRSLHLVIIEYIRTENLVIEVKKNKAASLTFFGRE